MSENVKIEQVTSTLQINTVVELASIILPTHYSPYIDMEHIEFFLDEFQSQSAIRKQIKEGLRYHLVYFNNEEVGYLAYSKNDEHIYLSKLYFLIESRGKGLGNLAIDFLIADAQKSGLKRIELAVNQNNSNSIKFYEKRGFNIVEEQTNHFRNGHCEKDYKMIKSLKFNPLI